MRGREGTVTPDVVAVAATGLPMLDHWLETRDGGGFDLVGFEWDAGPAAVEGLAAGGAGEVG